jgi:hypothetical protein
MMDEQTQKMLDAQVEEGLKAAAKSRMEFLFDKLYESLITADDAAEKQAALQRFNKGFALLSDTFQQTWQATHPCALAKPPCPVAD